MRKVPMHESTTKQVFSSKSHYYRRKKLCEQQEVQKSPLIQDINGETPKPRISVLDIADFLLNAYKWKTI